EIINAEMKLSEIGKIVADEWVKTQKIRKNIILGEWVIMPDHLHGIITIAEFIEPMNYSGNTYTGDIVDTHCNAYQRQPNAYQRQPNACLHYLNKSYKNKFGPQSQNLSAIIRGFKGAAKNESIMQISIILDGNQGFMTELFGILAN